MNVCCGEIVHNLFAGVVVGAFDAIVIDWQFFSIGLIDFCHHPFDAIFGDRLGINLEWRFTDALLQRWIIERAGSGFL